MTLALLALAVWLLPPLDRLGDRQRGVARAGRRALPHASGRRLLGLHRAEMADYLLYGSYPEDQRWRVDLVEISARR